ncbi:hypothetical protein CC1G_03144 [Coprinopsis cinerea okayama7|uniref:Metallo-beta-lactamase domain-containing protein n=1 Tax=Coprinopsis cinerea (strain Okayama-7 / 130 / ATCC MYA-4618 / FGSC 9003) TaxID=240176 RepID=A8PF35_COPC7|nr:hypothetical protein CC1G_03144 [Coprinopsis cinerea okayama7\|eukprot:XP_001840915.1 hypothetical protein CC1G_03144 [Coprinopsis cinerea okayama7\
MKRLSLDPTQERPATRDDSSNQPTTSLPPPKATKVSTGEKTDGSIYFIGNATVLLEWQGIRIMTDPNFLHAGDHVHLGPGVTATRVKNPAVDLHELPRVDAVLLSHYHEDHFDRLVEDSLRRDLPIITTPHAHHHLAEAKPGGEAFTSVYSLDFFESLFIDFKNQSAASGAKQPLIKVTGMPGKHVPPGPAHILSAANELLGMVPPTNGWMVELGYASGPAVAHEANFFCGYRIYISGDTLLVDELKEIPERYKDQKIDLMLVHLGGTSIPSANLPLMMVTMDATQGLQLVQMINPDVTIPIHFDDYDVFKSPLEDFKNAMEKAGLSDKVVYLDRGDSYRFPVSQNARPVQQN